MKFLLFIFSLLICNISYADIDLFEAHRVNNISIQYIANNEKNGQLIIENKTSKRLSIKLPQSFGLIPVLAQVGFNNGGIQPFNNGRNAGFNNGGIQQNSFQQLGGGFGNNAFAYVKPHGKSVIKTNTICLNYGLQTPNTRTRYNLVKLDEISNDTKLHYVIEQFSNNAINYQVAQALGWHVNSNMSWVELHNTNLFTRDELFFANSTIDKFKYNYIN